MVGQAGGMLLIRTAVVTGLARGLSKALAPWRPLAIHDPGKIVADLVISLALGGDCLADAALLRSEPAVYGKVASDPTISRLVSSLAADAPRVLKAIDTARATARARAWTLAGDRAPGREASVERSLVIDVDATLLRPGNAGSNTAADHITVVRQAFRQLPGLADQRPGKRVLVRADGAGHSHDLLDWLTGQRVQYSVGFTLPSDAATMIEQIPDRLWAPAYDPDRNPRDGAWVAELTGLLDLRAGPPT